MTNRSVGSAGERLAEIFLIEKGYALVERNYRAERCEIDLVMKHCGVTVFVEVKTRSGASYGLGREAVTKSKQRNIIQAAQRYIADNALFDAPCRFDVVEIMMGENRITHIENAFLAE